MSNEPKYLASNEKWKLIENRMKTKCKAKMQCKHFFVVDYLKASVFVN